MNPDQFASHTVLDCPRSGIGGPVGPQRAGDAVAIGDLVGPDGAAKSLALELTGSEIRLRGYIAPSLVADPSGFLLTEASLAPCQLCGNVHGPGAGLLVTPEHRVDTDIAMHEAIDVTGRLSAGGESDPTTGTLGEVGLIGARVWRLPTPTTSVQSDPRQWLRGYLAARPPVTARRRLADPSGVIRSVDATGPADFILRNGRIRTVDRAGTTAEAVAIRDGRFLAVGDTDSVERHAGPDTEILDLKGRTAIPGLIDSHIHQFYVGLNVPTVQLLDARSVADVQRKIADRAASTPAGDWIIGSSGWHESLLEEGRMPTRWELDEAAPDNPVIIPRGGHVVTVNSMALERAGVTDDTPDPTGGVIVRDPDSGEATGVLLEAAAYFARRVAPLTPSEDEMADLLKAAMKELNTFGIVSVVDPVIDETSLAVYRRLRDNDEITVRTDLLYKATDKAHTERGIAAMLAETSDDMLCFAGIKFMLDGGVEGARLRDPYRIVPGEQPHADYHGLLMLPPGGEDEFVEALTLVAKAGLQVQTHGVGDEAIDVIMRSYARANEATPIRDLRWTLMHVFLPSDEAIETMAEIGVLATVQDHPVLLGHNQRRWWGDKRAAEAIPIRRLIDDGLLVGVGSDGPVVPVDPFLSMWWMVTRQTLLGYAMGPDQAISAKEALELYTINNARIMGVEDRRGSIEPGKLADLVILSQDIVEVDPDEIRNTRALLTMVGGKVVHRDGIEL